MDLLFVAQGCFLQTSKLYAMMNRANCNYEHVHMIFGKCHWGSITLSHKLNAQMLTSELFESSWVNESYLITQFKAVLNASGHIGLKWVYHRFDLLLNLRPIQFTTFSWCLWGQFYRLSQFSTFWSFENAEPQLNLLLLKSKLWCVWKQTLTFLASFVICILSMLTSNSKGFEDT